MKSEAKKFINDIKDIRDYWVQLGKDQDYTVDHVCEGLVFSILSCIDGCATINDCHKILLVDEETDTKINDQDMLHENYYTEE